MQYSAGSATFTKASQTVSFGGGTDVQTYFAIGDLISPLGSNVWYQIGAVHASLPQVTLVEPYVGNSADANGTVYTARPYVLQTSFTTNFGFPYPEQGDIETASIVKRAIVMIDTKISAFAGGSLVAGRIPFAAAGNVLAYSGSLTYDSATNTFTTGRIIGTSTFATYCVDGLFDNNARPSYIQMPGSGRITFGYYDAGAAQYSPRIGFAHTWSSQTSTFSIGLSPFEHMVAPVHINSTQVAQFEAEGISTGGFRGHRYGVTARAIAGGTMGPGTGVHIFYDATVDKGFIQSQQPGVAHKNLSFRANDFDFFVSATNTLRIAAGVVTVPVLLANAGGLATDNAAGNTSSVTLRSGGVDKGYIGISTSTGTGWQNSPSATSAYALVVRSEIGEIDFTAGPVRMAALTTAGLNVAGWVVAGLKNSTFNTIDQNAIIANTSWSGANARTIVNIQKGGAGSGGLGVDADGNVSVMEAAGIPRITANSAGMSVNGSITASDTLTVTGPSRTGYYASAGMQILRDGSDSAAAGPFVYFLNRAASAGWIMQMDGSNGLAFKCLASGWSNSMVISSGGVDMLSANISGAVTAGGAVNFTSALTVGTQYNGPNFCNLANNYSGGTGYMMFIDNYASGAARGYIGWGPALFSGAPASAFGVGSGSDVWIGTGGNTVVHKFSTGGLAVNGQTDSSGYTIASWNAMTYSGNELRIGQALAANMWDNIAFYLKAGKRAELSSSGYFKASPAGSGTGGYSTAGASHEFTTTANDTALIQFRHNGSVATSQYGLQVYLAGDPNTSSNYFFVGVGNATTRLTLLANGGVSGYSANNVNLSDEREKRDFEKMPSFYDEWLQIDWLFYKLRDQDHDDFNAGVTAQQVGSVFAQKAPWIVGEFPSATGEKRLGLYENDFNFIGGAVLAETQARQVADRKRLDALEAFRDRAIAKFPELALID